ncbi:MAG: helix-turn-helix domain-containing protein [Solidesulfovibrio sp.]
MNTTVTPSSGNIFADLDLPDADDLQYKTDLVVRIQRIMKQRGLTQKMVASLCGTDQPTISKVLRGRIDLVGTQRLLGWLRCLGMRVSITIEDAAPDTPANIVVLS